MILNYLKIIDAHTLIFFISCHTLISIFNHRLYFFILKQYILTIEHFSISWIKSLSTANFCCNFFRQILQMSSNSFWRIWSNHFFNWINASIIDCTRLIKAIIIYEIFFFIELNGEIFLTTILFIWLKMILLFQLKWLFCR